MFFESNNRTKENTEIEISKIKKQLNCNIDGDYREINKNQFQVLDDNFHIDIKTWGENEYSYVEIKLINRNVQYSTLDLKNMLKRIKEEKSEDEQYFLYYKEVLKN